MITKSNLFRLSGKIQHYQWGGFDFIPDLLDISNPDHQPYAEYWLGAHENASSEIINDGGKQPLGQYIAQHPEVLGENVRNEFKRLPYLFKVLDVKDMLSIQVHPSRKAAAAEFERENKTGVALDAPHRNYKDDNHKPELMVALGDFWLLHGFKSPEKIREIISTVPEFAFMGPLFEEGGYKKLYEVLMTMEQAEVNRILQPLLERIVAAYEVDYLPKGSAHFWAARAAYTFNVPGVIDRGIFSIYLLNLVHLNEGEAIFQDSGVLHAYLEGQNMEIMANSDNVLRGGLTPKHIDVNELIKHVKFDAVEPRVVQAVLKEGEEIFPSPARDFRLSRLVVDAATTVSLLSSTADIFLVLKGEAVLKDAEGHSLVLKKGEAAVSFSGAQIQVSSLQKAVVFRATAGL